MENKLGWIGLATLFANRLAVVLPWLLKQLKEFCKKPPKKTTPRLLVKADAAKILQKLDEVQVELRDVKRTVGDTLDLLEIIDEERKGKI